MKSTSIFTIAALAAAALAGQTLSAQVTVTSEIEGVKASAPVVYRDGSSVTLDMDLDLSDLEVRSGQAVLVTPYLVKGSDSLAFPSVGVYGRQRYYYYLRQGKKISGETETSFRNGEATDVIKYHASVPSAKWMTGAALVLGRKDYGCRECQTASQSADVLAKTLWTPSMPELIYVGTEAEKTKSRSLSGVAYVDFPVDRTEIHTDYHNNAVELGKIRATIDSVRMDSDITVTSIWLKGYASPEGTYAHNTDLARERTATIRNYVQNLFKFPSSVFKTEFEPENWDGLLAWVRKSSLTDADKILEMAEAEPDPDIREFRIRRYCPESYEIMKSEVYPGLRCTEYKIDYSIRSYADPQEILKVMKTNPNKLSLQEFYTAASTLDKGSDEFNTVFETAAAMYPADETANLNAANAAISRGDYSIAAERLEKAGGSAEADYARGVLAIAQSDYSSALDHFKVASAKGLEEAGPQVEILNEYFRTAGKK